MSKKNNKPEIIQLSSKNIDEIQSRLTESSLNDADKEIISTILTTYQWLCRQLLMARFSMHKLKTIFGLKTEKKVHLKKLNPDDFSSSENNTNSLEITPSTESTPKKP